MREHTGRTGQGLGSWYCMLSLSLLGPGLDRFHSGFGFSLSLDIGFLFCTLSLLMYKRVLFLSHIVIVDSDFVILPFQFPGLHGQRLLQGLLALPLHSLQLLLIVRDDGRSNCFDMFFGC